MVDGGRLNDNLVRVVVYLLKGPSMSLQKDSC